MDENTQTQPTDSRDEKFSEFINTYSLSWAANHFLSIMTPEQRVKFFEVVSKTYSDDWAEAVAKLAGCR